MAAALLAALSVVLLRWTMNVRPFPESFPLEIPPLVQLALQAAALVLGAAAFAAAGGRGGARLGAVFGLLMTAIGWCAARWPVLARAIEMNGGIFAGPFLAALLGTAFAATAAFVAAALLLPAWRPYSLRLVAAAVLAWALPTAAVELSLERWWGLGPRTVAEAAGVPTNADAQTVAILRLAPSRGRSFTRETERMAAQNVDLSPESLAKLQLFLQRVGYRDVFAREALEDVRRGWLLWWDADRALDAMLVSVPGRVHPDYRGALDLLKVGPMTAERYEKLERLDAAAAESPAGFEQVTQSQYIFEGFAAAYARFGDETNARKWLARIDNLMMVSEKKVEVAPLEDFREGRVSGTLLVDGRPGGSVMVGLFDVWRTTPTAAGVRLLSTSAFPDENGRFSFQHLAPGEYELGLLGRPEDLRGRLSGAPGRFVVAEDKPAVDLPPILIEREVLPAPGAFQPSGLPEAPVPEIPETPLLWPKR